MRTRSGISLLLALWSSAQVIIWAQQPAGPPQQPSTPEGAKARKAFSVRVLAGDGVINSLASRTSVGAAIEVLDSLGDPVSGAEVVFSAPETGPGGRFGNGMTHYNTRTDTRGQAVSDFSPNTLPGAFVIRAEVSFRGETVAVALRQTNDPQALVAGPIPPKRPWYKDWKWWTAIGAGAGTGSYFAFRSSSSTTVLSSQTTISIVPGAIVIGGRR